jgi:hypothetical protein
MRRVHSRLAKQSSARRRVSPVTTPGRPTGYKQKAMIKRTLTALALSIGLAGSAVAPALADGAASTRNILIGGAVGALLIINHNKKVHERYAEDARRQAVAENNAANSQAAYQSERTAYQNEAALVSQYKREVAVQHSQILGLRKQVAMTRTNHAAFATTAHPLTPARTNVASSSTDRPLRIASTSYGWGQL